MQFKTSRANNIIKTGENAIERKQAKNIVKEKKADLETENLATDKKIRGNKLLASMRRSWIIFLIISVVCSLISVAESVAGVCAGITNNPFAILIFGIVMCVLQISVICYNYQSATIEQLHFSAFSILDKFALVVMGVSIACNYQFMKGIVNNDSLFYTLVTLVLASGLDLLSRYCSRLAYNAHYRNYSQRGYVRQNLLHKIYMIVFGKLLHNIDTRYSEIMEEMGTQENDDRYVIGTSNLIDSQESKIASNVGKQGILTTSKNIDEENESTSNLLRTSTTKEIKSAKELECEISKLEDGTRLEPKLFDLQKNKSYYNWIKQCNNVKKVDNKYIKVKPSISLVKAD